MFFFFFFGIIRILFVCQDLFLEPFFFISILFISQDLVQVSTCLITCGLLKGFAKELFYSQTSSSEVLIEYYIQIKTCSTRSKLHIV